MELYVKTGCPYCAKVLAALKEHNVPFEEKNISDDSVVEELLAKGGKRQVPYIVDGDVSMYESDAIVGYIHEKYMTGEKKPHVEVVSGGHCEVDSENTKGGCSF